MNYIKIEKIIEVGMRAKSHWKFSFLGVKELCEFLGLSFVD